MLIDANNALATVQLKMPAKRYSRTQSDTYYVFSRTLLNSASTFCYILSGEVSYILTKNASRWAGGQARGLSIYSIWKVTMSV